MVQEVKGHRVYETATDEHGVTYGRCTRCNRRLWRHPEDSHGRWVQGDGAWEPTQCDGRWVISPAPAHDGGVPEGA